LIGMLKGIVAFEIPVLRIEAKRKMSQNKNTDIQKLSIDGLRLMNDLQSSSVADEMESNI
jgi:predicted FMN-binding regulatory protein PaiB